MTIHLYDMTTTASVQTYAQHMTLTRRWISSKVANLRVSLGCARASFTCNPPTPEMRNFYRTTNLSKAKMSSKMKRALARIRGRNTPPKCPAEDLVIETDIPNGDAMIEQQPHLQRVPTVEQQILDELIYWGLTRKIKEAQLVALLERVVGSKSYKLTNRLNGAFNVAYILESPDALKVCIRVPACGFPARWNK